MTLSTALAAKGSRRVMQTITTPSAIVAPIGGWNTRDALDAMDPKDAITLDNWFPDSGACNVRGGSTSYATGMGAGNVETLAELNAGSVRKFVAAANNNIYDISSSGAAVSKASGYTNNRWQTANFNGLLHLCNGADAPQAYDGTTVTAPSWTGPTLANLLGCVPFKFRLWFWEKASQNAWYGGVNAITGALTAFPLATVAQTGGNIVAINTLSNSGVESPDDYLLFFLSSGEVVIYQGTDPSSASTFALIGRFIIGPIVNTRSVCRYGADCYATIQDDHTSMSIILAALRSGQPLPKSKISGAVQDAVISNSNAFGWQALTYPRGHMVIFNIPNIDGTFSQHVMSTITQSWCRFNGWAASTFGLFNNNLYFGTTGGSVYQANNGNSDVGSLAITANGQQAWSPLGATPQNSFNAAYRKRIAAVRPIISSSGSISYSYGIGVDYQSIIVQTPAITTPGGSAWDVSPWDTSPWSSETGTIDPRWRSGSGSGQSISVAISVMAQQAVSWLRTDLMVEQGTKL